MNKENWINDILDSTAGMQRPTAPDGIFEGAMNKLPVQPATRNLTLKLGIAATTVMLLLNAGTVVHYIHNNKKNIEATQNPGEQHETIISINTYNY